MKKSVAMFLVGVIFTILFIMLADWMGVGGPRWVLLFICGALGVGLAKVFFHLWSRRAPAGSS